MVLIVNFYGRFIVFSFFLVHLISVATSFEKMNETDSFISNIYFVGLWFANPPKTRWCQGRHAKVLYCICNITSHKPVFRTIDHKEWYCGHIPKIPPSQWLLTLIPLVGPWAVGLPKLIGVRNYTLKSCILEIVHHISVFWEITESNIMNTPKQIWHQLNFSFRRIFPMLIVWTKYTHNTVNTFPFHFLSLTQQSDPQFPQYLLLPKWLLAVSLSLCALP